MTEESSDSRIIVASNFSQHLKTGIYFSIENDDRVFTGDLFYDLAFQEFQIRGIPAHEGRRRHVFLAEFRGPCLIDMVLDGIGLEQVRPGNDKYVDITCKKGRITSALAAHIEEWFGGDSVMGLIDRSFQVKQDLTWYKG